VTTTTIVEQGSKAGSASNVNNCPYSSPDVDLGSPPPVANITAKISTVGFPQPHLGQPITLSGTTVELTFPAEFLQVAVNANVTNLPDSSASLTIAGSNTTQKTKTINFTVPGGPIPLDGSGNAKAVTVKVSLPNTTWTPANGTDDVVFSEKSLKLKTVLDVGFEVHVNIDCAPNGSMQFLALGAQGEAAPTTTTPIGTEGGATTTTTAAGTPVTQSGTLPRTGGNVLLLFVLAAMLIDLGIAMTGAARKRMHYFG
jgi:hypothetical protein